MGLGPRSAFAIALAALVAACGLNLSGADRDAKDATAPSDTGTSGTSGTSGADASDSGTSPLPDASSSGSSGGADACAASQHVVCADGVSCKLGTSCNACGAGPLATCGNECLTTCATCAAAPHTCYSCTGGGSPAPSCAAVTTILGNSTVNCSFATCGCNSPADCPGADNVCHDFGGFFPFGKKCVTCGAAASDGDMCKVAASGNGKCDQQAATCTGN